MRKTLGCHEGTEMMVTSSVGTQTGTSVPADSDDQQNVRSTPEAIKKAVFGSDEVLRQSRFR